MADKMRDVKGKTNNYDMPSKPQPIKPSFRITENDLPEIKDWSVGKKYKLMIEVEMKNVGKSEWSNDKTIEASLTITKLAVEKGGEMSFADLRKKKDQVRGY